MKTICVPYLSMWAPQAKVRVCAACVCAEGKKMYGVWSLLVCPISCHVNRQLCLSFTARGLVWTKFYEENLKFNKVF